jgi:hypothetical protein
MLALQDTEMQHWSNSQMLPAFGAELDDVNQHHNSENPWKDRNEDGAGQLPFERHWGVEPDQPF